MALESIISTIILKQLSVSSGSLAGASFEMKILSFNYFQHMNYSRAPLAQPEMLLLQRKEAKKERLSRKNPRE